jgi:hypothetical protein
MRDHALWKHATSFFVKVVRIDLRSLEESQRGARRCRNRSCTTARRLKKFSLGPLATEYHGLGHLECTPVVRALGSKILVQMNEGDVVLDNDAM